MATSSRTLKERAYEEFKRFLVYTLYLWGVFSLFALYKGVILAEDRIDLLPYGIALINALALAKIALVARALHLGDQANDAPLVYATPVKAGLFTIVLAFFKILEDGAVGYYHGKPFRLSLTDFAGGTWTGVFSFVLIMCVMLVPLVGMIELRRVLGDEQFKQVFLQPARKQDWRAPQAEEVR